METAGAITAISNEGLVESFRADKLNVYVYDTRTKMGAAAAEAVAAELSRLIEAQGRAAAVFASAPSQNEFLATLASAPGVDWQRVVGFHLDEYLGMDERAPQSFRRFLVDRLVSKVGLREFHGLRGGMRAIRSSAGGQSARLRRARHRRERAPGFY